MTFYEFWDRHPQWIAGLFGERFWPYWLVHLLIGYATATVIAPGLGQVFEWLMLIPYNLGRFIAFHLWVLAAAAATYLFAVLPVRVFGTEMPHGYFCVLATLASLPYFLD